MRRKHKIWSTVFVIVCGLTALSFTFQVLPNFEEILNAGVAYYAGYIVGWLFPVFIFWIIKMFFKPENVLKRKGFGKEVNSLKQLLKSNSISRQEYNEKLDSIEKKNNQLNIEKTEGDNAQININNINNELKAITELKESGVLEEDEFEYKKAMLELKKSQGDFEFENIRKIIKKYDFESLDKAEFLTKEFNPKMSERSTADLLKLLTNEGYEKAAVYQAYEELKQRNK